MSIEFRCAHCRAVLRVAEENAGRNARCPSCGAVSRAPGGPGPRDGTSAAEWEMQTPDGRVYGPVPRVELEMWAEQGRLSEYCRIRRAGGPWRAAHEFIPQLLETTDGARPTVGPTRPRPHRGPLLLGMATIGMLTALALACPVFGVLAWVLAAADLQDIGAGAVDPAGRKQAILAFRLGLASTLLAFLVMVGGVLILPFLERMFFVW